MTQYGLGIDAGGTYTDTVVIDMESGAIMCGNKALTTREDLSVGIRNSLSSLEKSYLEHISLTSLSSTLATNSVVEGKGCRVGLICIGTGPASSEMEHYARINGKFNMSGREEIPLDIDATRDALARMKGKVDALAVSGYVSVRNPDHEDRISNLAAEMLGVPVVCAHDLTSKLGFEQRTTTAVMNARLIPVIEELLESVKAVLREFNIDSPLMVVKGDGALMSEETACRKPIETILSGPASSLIGAKTLSGRNDAVMIDIGGTTSDIGILRNGFPRIEPEGARIAGKRTRVMAADISTYGIGGDSRILVNGRDIILSSVRVIPLCVAAARWPSVKETISALSGIIDDRSAEDYPLGDVLQDTEFLMLAHTRNIEDLPDYDRRLLTFLKDGPARVVDIGKALGVPPHAFSVGELESRGFVTRIGVTPTDILHAEGSCTAYDRETSSIAVGYLARKCGTDTTEFIRDLKERISMKIAASTIEKVLLDSSPLDSLDTADEKLIEHITSGQSSEFSVGFNLNLPIIGVGAPVSAWLPRVAELLHTELIIPENSAIGNAIGAISGSVSETVTVTVRASTSEMVENPPCNVFTGKKVESFDNYVDALSYAKETCMDMARQAAIDSGAVEPVIEVSVDEDYVELSETKRFFRGATITVRATGKPDFS